MASSWPSCPPLTAVQKYSARGGKTLAWYKRKFGDKFVLLGDFICTGTFFISGVIHISELLPDEIPTVGVFSLEDARRRLAAQYNTQGYTGMLDWSPLLKQGRRYRKYRRHKGSVLRSRETPADIRRIIRRVSGEEAVSYSGIFRGIGVKIENIVLNNVDQKKGKERTSEEIPEDTQKQKKAKFYSP